MESRAAKMTWGELEKRAKSVGVAIIPGGSTERHGWHLPLGTDAAYACEVADRVGERTGAVVFPPLTYGIRETTAYQGVYLSGNIFSSLVREICSDIESLGFQRILFITAHHENNPFIFDVIKERFNQKPNERIYCIIHCGTLAVQIMPDLVKPEHGGHSGFRETSVMLAIDEELVHLDRASQPKKIHKRFFGELESVDVHVVALREGKGKVILCHNTEELTSAAGYGVIEGTSREYGEKVLEGSVNYISRVVDELKAIELPMK